MWECVNCKEQIEDKYKHCWNCGKPKAEAHPVAPPPKILHLNDEPPPPAEKLRSEAVPPPVEEKPPPVETAAAEKLPPPREDSLFETALTYKEKKDSKIGNIVPLVLWLAAFLAVAAFTYYSYQKTRDFENRIAEDARKIGAQTNQFTFTPTTSREKKGAAKTAPLNVQPKVLPLNLQTKEIDGLYNFLPDDLRPATIDEVKTLLWLDCKPSEAGQYEDGSPAFQDRCNGYLVDRNSSKVIQVQDFLGELPPLKKQWGTSYASGKVLPETYISYVRANQPENERAPERFATDSPNHHVWFKSELLYSSILLAFLGAIGIGWIVYKIKSISWKPE